MFGKRKKILFDKPDNSDVPNKLNGGDMTSYVGKTKDEIKRAFFGPGLAQRLEEDPVPFGYFFILWNNFSAKFVGGVESSDSVPLYHAIVRYVYELDHREAEYDQIVQLRDDFVKNHFEVAMKCALSDEPLPAGIKNNFFDYLDSDQKRRIMYNAYLFVRSAILTYQNEIEERFGKIKSNNLNDYNLLFA